MHVADSLVETAVRAGAERFYGLIGDGLNPIGDAIRRDGRLQWVHVRQEEAPSLVVEHKLPAVPRCAPVRRDPSHLQLPNGLYDSNRTRTPDFALPRP